MSVPTPQIWCKYGLDTPYLGGSVRTLKKLFGHFCYTQVAPEPTNLKDNLTLARIFFRKKIAAKTKNQKKDIFTSQIWPRIEVHHIYTGCFKKKVQMFIPKIQDTKCMTHFLNSVNRKQRRAYITVRLYIWCTSILGHI